MAKTVAGLQKRLNDLVNAGMSNREYCWFVSKLTKNGRKRAAHYANEQYWLPGGGWEDQCYWAVLDDTCFTGVVSAFPGCWNVMMPGGGTYYVPYRFIKKMTKMGLKRELRHWKEKKEVYKNNLDD